MKRRRWCSSPPGPSRQSDPSRDAAHHRSGASWLALSSGSTAANQRAALRCIGRWRQRWGAWWVPVKEVTDGNRVRVSVNLLSARKNPQCHVFLVLTQTWSGSGKTWSLSKACPSFSKGGPPYDSLSQQGKSCRGFYLVRVSKQVDSKINTQFNLLRHKVHPSGSSCLSVVQEGNPGLIYLKTLFSSSWGILKCYLTWEDMMSI